MNPTTMNTNETWDGDIQPAPLKQEMKPNNTMSAHTRGSKENDSCWNTCSRVCAAVCNVIECLCNLNQESISPTYKGTVRVLIPADQIHYWRK